MSYADIKKSYDSARREQLGVDKEISRIETQLKKLETTYPEIEKRYQALIADDKLNAMGKFQKSRIVPFETKLSEDEKRLRKTRAEYDSKKSEISYDNLLAQCSSKQDILEEVRNASTVLEERLRSLVGDRFYGVLSENLDSREINFESENLDKLIRYFNASEKTVERYARKGSVLQNFIDDVENRILANDEGEDGKALSIVIAVGMLIAIIFYCRIMLPVEAILLAIFSIYNVMRNYRVYHILVIQKAVQENIDKIDAHLRKQIEEEVLRQQSELDSQYLPVIQALESEIAKLNQDIVNAEAEAKAIFQYDESGMVNRKKAEIEKVDKQKSQLLIQKRQQQELLSQKTQIVEDLSEQLSGMLKGLQDTFLSGVGEAIIFDPKFLFDIDTVKNRPVFFTHPQSSCLFLYEDIKDVYDLIRLFAVELRAKLNPFNLSIAVADLKNLGQDLIYFTASEGGSDVEISSLFRMIVNADDLKAFVQTTADDLLRRQSNIRREFGDIAAYNQKMVELNSLTESYDFQFIVDPDNNWINNPKVQSVLRVGGVLGIFSHVFIEKSEFVKLKDYATIILDIIGKVYYLENGNYFERAKDFVVDNLLSEEDE